MNSETLNRGGARLCRDSGRTSWWHQRWTYGVRFHTKRTQVFSIRMKMFFSPPSFGGQNDTYHVDQMPDWGRPDKGPVGVQTRVQITCQFGPDNLAKLGPDTLKKEKAKKGLDEKSTLIWAHVDGIFGPNFDFFFLRVSDPKIGMVSEGYLEGYLNPQDDPQDYHHFKVIWTFGRTIWTIIRI